MGQRQSWIAIKSEKVSELLAYLKLRPGGKRCQTCDFDWNYADMLNGWHVVIRNSDLINENVGLLSGASAISEIIVGGVEEHVNYSVCEFWRNKQRVWLIQYVWRDDHPELTTEGPVPACFQNIKNQCEAKQAADKEVDYLIEIPLLVCEELCRYAHDHDIEGLPPEPCEELVQMSSFDRMSNTKVEKSETIADMIRSFFKSKD